MKIFIHTDMEGISGIACMEELMRTNKAVYRKSCEKMMEDINAAVDGAFEGGATQVTVLDSHGGGGNFIHEILDKRAESDPRENKKWWGKLDGSYRGTFFIGAHAMAGTINGFLDHTQSSVAWFSYHINGRVCGELTQWATVAGAYDVPLIMVSGDEAGCAEARSFFNPLETAAVKQGLGRNNAVVYPAHEARQAIKNAAKKAMALIGTARPFKPLVPMDVKLTVTRSDYADALTGRAGVERLDARTVRKVVQDPLELLF